jgi:CHAD domain-containing protein
MALCCHMPVIYWLNGPLRMKPQGRVGRHPTTNRAKPRVTTTLLARRTRALQRYLPAAIRGDDHGVHQARVATRRLREAVPVLTAGVKGSKAARAKRKIRRLTRALGTVRELDVTMHVLNELARRPEIPRNALEDVRAHVLAESDERRKVMLERLEDVNTQKLGRRLHSVAAALAVGDANAWRQTLGARILKRAKRFSDAVHEAGHIYAPDRLHQVRIAAKKLRYALELADDGGVAAAHPLVNELKRTQDTLGRLHDLQVLQHHVAEVQSAPPMRRGGADGGLDAIGRALEAECRHLHGKYLASFAVLLEASEQCRTVVAPQLARPAHHRQSVLKMALPTPRPKATARRA